MFDRLFTLPAVLARHRIGPMAEERTRFLTHLEGLGLSLRTLQGHAALLLVITDALKLAERPGEFVSTQEIAQKVVGTRDTFVPLATSWLRFLGRLRPEPTPTSKYAAKLKTFADSTRNERDLSVLTIRDRCKIVQQFLEHLGIPGSSLRSVTISQVDEALQGMVTRQSRAPRTVQGLASHLRIFFRYAETRGWCRRGLAESINSPRAFTHASLPQGPSWDQVRQLLAMTEGNAAIDIRDRAVLMLFAIYGLRANEVRHLRLDDFDWESELIHVSCPKSRKLRTFPLVRLVGDAILRYLQEVRPQSSHRALFMTLLPPIRPLLSFWDIVGKRLRSLGVTTPHHGPHALRHACATHLLAEGFSLKEIGDHLGHQQPETTRIYAKVDLLGLRQVADFQLEVLP